MNLVIDNATLTAVALFARAARLSEADGISGCCRLVAHCRDSKLRHVTAVTIRGAFGGGLEVVEALLEFGIISGSEPYLLHLVEASVGESPVVDAELALSPPAVAPPKRALPAKSRRTERTTEEAEALYQKRRANALASADKRRANKAAAQSLQSLSDSLPIAKSDHQVARPIAKSDSQVAKSDSQSDSLAIRGVGGSSSFKEAKNVNNIINLKTTTTPQRARGSDSLIAKSDSQVAKSDSLGERKERTQKAQAASAAFRERVLRLQAIWREHRPPECPAWEGPPVGRLAAAAARAFELHPDPDWWVATVKRLHGIPFFRGQGPTSSGWCCTPEWLFEPGNAEAVASGRRDPFTPRPSAPPPMSDPWAGCDPQAVAAYRAALADLRASNQSNPHLGFIVSQLEQLRPSFVDGHIELQGTDPLFAKHCAENYGALLGEYLPGTVFSDVRYLPPKPSAITLGATP